MPRSPARRRRRRRLHLCPAPRSSRPPRLALPILLAKSPYFDSRWMISNTWTLRNCPPYLENCLKCLMLHVKIIPWSKYAHLSQRWTTLPILETTCSIMFDIVFIRFRRLFLYLMGVFLLNEHLCLGQSLVFPPKFINLMKHLTNEGIGARTCCLEFGPLSGRKRAFSSKFATSTPSIEKENG